MSVEPRYNLATKVMSNGVEVIVAGDRTTRPGEPEYLRLLSSTVTRPITLAPHTLSHHMSMLLPADFQSENDVMSSLRPVDHFSTSTFYTTYLFPTEIVQDKETMTTMTSTVVTNVQQVNGEGSAPASTKEVTLSASPVMESQVHRTVLTYLNTVMDEDQPLVATSRHTVSNTLQAPSSVPQLEPSELMPETNTYFATRQFVRTVTDGTESKVVSTTDVVTRVVITDPPSIETVTNDPNVIDVTKTYFVTYTYFSTYLEDEETKVSSHVSVSTDIAVEQFTVKTKQTTSDITPTPIAVAIEPTRVEESSKTEEAHFEKLSSELPDEADNSIATPDLDDEDQLTASSGDIIDEWYEKFKIKPTTEDITKTRTKTKTTLKHKLKTKTSSKVSIEPTSTYSTSIVMVSTVTPQGSTLVPGDQVIVIHGENGQTSMIPLSDPAKKKHKNGTDQVSDMMSLGALGINSMNVLGPVFNAMADMLKNHQKDALKRRNDTVPVNKTPNNNPILNFMSNLAGNSGEAKNPKTTTTPRAPLYIPVGSFAEDAETSESEGRISVLPKPEKWGQEKWPSKPTHHLDKNRRTHDNNPMPHLDGGIPISPGQVITTNSDVIIGRPSDSGPRPPNFAVKDNLPVGMKPPPLEEQRVHLEPVGQFSTNQDTRPVEEMMMKPPPLPKPGRPQQPQKPRPQAPAPPPPVVQARPPQSNHPARPSKQPHGHHNLHDSGAFDLNPPPPPPLLHHPLPILPIPVHLNPDEVVENYVNPVHLHPDNLALPNEVMPTPSIPREISRVVDRSNGQPLLVNIQPSQVAQVMIPHGSSSAVIISDQQPHSTKGEVIDDPSPHPEPETVGFIGAEPVLKVDNNVILHRPVNSMAEVIKVETVLHHQHPNQQNHQQQHETVNARPRPDYDNIGMKPPTEPKHQQGLFLQHELQNQHHVLQTQHPQHPQLQHQPQYTLSKKDPSGIYVDISPPGHLPPPPKMQRPANTQQQPQQMTPDNLANHQSGVVHDVPLVAQVQLGSGKPETAPLNEILVNFDAELPPSGAQVKDDQNFVHRPVNSYPADLSPPPPPPRPVRPPGHIHRYPVAHDKPSHPSVPEPADFMIPPPEPTFTNPMVIPVGAGASNHRPSSRPGEILVGQSDYESEEDMETDANDTFKTEDGEEIQESNTRPLLPGQVPTEIEKLLQNHTSYPSNIGVGQTLSFGSMSDKADDNNPPGVREPETIVGSQMHGHGNHGPSGFNNQNEAVVSVGSQPMMEGSAMDMDEAEKMFGMKLPQKNSENLTRSDDVNEILKHPKSDEVMGMSPPPIDRPVERPRRPVRPRPQTPFKFEMPTAPNLPGPINMENDFPPVRSPDLNKKPFKPEDVFPPRLPENFVYREYEISTRKPVNRRPMVTSMPIDSPTSTTEGPLDVNGHSKPVKVDSQYNAEVTSPPPVERPKPVVHERPPNVNMQKPSMRPPTRQPPVHQRHPPAEAPLRGQDTDSKRGQPPFPFERPAGDGHFGEKVRQPSQQMTPPKTQPPRTPTVFEQPPKRPPPSYAQPPPRVEIPMLEPPPPPRPSQGRPPHRPTVFDHPPRQPPSGFDHPPNRPNIYEHPPSRPNFEQPPRTPPSGMEQRPGFEQPPRPSPSGFEQPPRPPQPGFDQQPRPFEHPPTRPAPSVHDPPTRTPPSGFERPPSPTPSEYEQPPPRGQPSFEEKPHAYQHPTRGQPPKFEAPPNRVEPSPHFEGQPTQGQPPKEVKPTPERPNTVDAPHSTSGTPHKPSPPALHKPSYKPSQEQDQLPQPTTASESNEKNQVLDQTPERNEPIRYEEKPPKIEIPGKRPSFDEERLQKLPPKVQLPYRPTPTVKPPKIPVPSREQIRPTSVSEAGGSTFMAEPSRNIVTSMVTSGSTTIFGDLYTEPMLLQPTRVVTSNQGIQFSVSSFPSGQHSPPQKVMVIASTPMQIHATTLTVTSTMTTVLHGAGQSPTTRTVLLTTTIISTIFDKITETETLLKPTTSTVTQTHTISTTKTALVVPTAIYPPRPGAYPSAKPEIFVADPREKPAQPEIIIADPHDKIAKPEIFVADPRDKDTMTISVSSTMSKKDHKNHKDQLDNESILVVVTDKPSSGGKPEGKIVLAGALPPPAPYPHPGSATECLPECRPSRNELCIKQEGFMKCVCRPGFARMFPDQPCKPTYTYSMQLTLDRMGVDPVQYQQGLQVPGSPKYVRLAGAAKEGLNRMVMQSDLRDIYHGIAVSGFHPKDKKTMVDFYVQLSENVEDGKVLGVFKKSLRNSNFSLGGTEMFAARESDNVHIQDFNECLNGRFHDCSEHSRCFNLKGTYTCSCKEGFTDVSENTLYPGRLCSDMIGCEYCGYHGTCYSREEQQTCECFQWYTGDRCRINLKVLLIALVTIGAILLALLLVCIVMTCLKRRSSNASRANGSTGYLRYRGPPKAMDQRAMIVDTSSESSVENLPYVSAPPPPPLPQPAMGPPRKPALRQVKRPAPRPQQVPVDQRDRSLTVMIPRVKYRTGPPVSPSSPHLTMSTFSPDKHINRTAAQMATEQKLLNYLDGGSREGGSGQQSQRPSKEEKRIYDPKPSNNNNNMNTKKEPRVFEYEYKTSNMNILDGSSSGERRSKDDRFRRFSDQTPLHHQGNSLHHRKYSAGALVSAGYAVSATGGLIHDVEESTIHSNTLKSNRSQFTTLNRSGDHKTMSEARSYDETLIQPQTRPLRTTYSGSSSSRLHPDENHTMVERDLGSTFLLPESHLFKPAGDRGSDISNFDSL